MKRALFLSLLALLSVSAAARAGLAEPPRTEISGTVFSFDQQMSILTVNTRLGPKRFRTTPTTLYLLNNHSAVANNILPGDRVVVTFRFDTSEAFIVHLFRKIRQSGRITAVSTTGAATIDLRLGANAGLQLRVDSLSRVELEGIPISDRRVLVGRNARAVFEPASFLLLDLEASSPTINGEITAIETAERRVTVRGRNTRVITLDAMATLLRAGQAIGIGDLAVGNRVRVAFVRQGDTLRGLALVARKG